MKTLIDIDPFSRIETWHHYDPETDETTIETIQDCEPFLELNKTQQNDRDYKRHGIDSEFLHVARIPSTVIEKWLLEEKLDVFNRFHWPRVKRKLMDPEWRHLRTTLGGL